MSYAASGQLTGGAKNGTSFINVHDDSGRLIEAKADGATLATYSYGAFEQRVAKTTTAAAPGGASSVHFIHDQFDRLIAEHNGSTGAPLREYVWLGLMPVAFIDYSSGSPVTYYLHVDQVMNPQKLTDGSGAVVWDRVQDPFGVEFSATGSLTLPSRFPGLADRLAHGVERRLFLARAFQRGRRRPHQRPQPADGDRRDRYQP